MPPASQIETRLENVLTTIYLLFNEGYYSLSQNQTLRKDLCLEAMRLCTMLVENESTNKPSVNALLSTRCAFTPPASMRESMKMGIRCCMKTKMRICGIRN